MQCCAFCLIQATPAFKVNQCQLISRCNWWRLIWSQLIKLVRRDLGCNFGQPGSNRSPSITSWNQLTLINPESRGCLYQAKCATLIGVCWLCCRPRYMYNISNTENDRILIAKMQTDKFVYFTTKECLRKRVCVMTNNFLCRIDATK